MLDSLEVDDDDFLDYLIGYILCDLIVASSNPLEKAKSVAERITHASLAAPIERLQFSFERCACIDSSCDRGFKV